MRYDMAKVVVERPRAGSKWRYKDRRPGLNRGDPEELHSNLSMRRPYGYERKKFTDLLGPLQGFIRSRVGRKWDDVYSEVCERIGGNSTVQLHILQHLFQFVSVKVVRLADGTLEERGRFWPQSIYPSEFFVDPDDGILKRNPARDLWRLGRRFPRQDQNPDHKVFGLEDEVVKIKGCWHRVYFADAEGPYTGKREDGTEYTINRYSYDIVSGNVLDGRYRAVTRQLDRKTLRRLGLENDIPE